MVAAQHRGKSSDDGKKTLDSRSILKVKPTGFPDGLDMGYEGEKKNGSKVFGLSK